MQPTELARMFTRDLTRLAQQVRAFPDVESLWKTAPGVSNAAGTLVLHLEGNLREFIGRLLGGVAYMRDRPTEFSTRGTSREELVARVESVRDVVRNALEHMTPATLSAPYPGGFLDEPLSTYGVLVHLSGHLNYHLGQIDYLRRQVTGDGAIALAGLPPAAPPPG
ncbi:MAG TPA: DinB family protein [Luteitalea sp.]|nr:DinB family protein [Luteitalea sp.]